MAHALSNMCRYGGHCPVFYSVAQHSVRCSEKCEEEGGSLIEQLECLLHDTPEYVLVDLPKPIKKNIPQYNEIENKLQKFEKNKSQSVTTTIKSQTFLPTKTKWRLTSLRKIACGWVATCCGEFLGAPKKFSTIGE